MLIASIMFLQLAKRWPRLIKEWTIVETAMDTCYGWPKYYDLRIKTLTIIVFLLTTGTWEYFDWLTDLMIGFLSVVYVLKLVTYVNSTFQCKKQRDFFYYFYAKESFLYVFQMIDYNPWKAAWMQVKIDMFRYKFAFPFRLLLLQKFADCRCLHYVRLVLFGFVHHRDEHVVSDAIRTDNGAIANAWRRKGVHRLRYFANFS